MEQRIRKAFGEMAAGVNPRPLPHEPRDHAWHWGTFLNGSSRTQPLYKVGRRDAMVAIITGLMLGFSISFTAMRGFWPPAGELGGMFLVVHLIVLGLGQTVDGARLTRSDLLRVAAAGGAAILVGALVALVVMA